MGYGKVASAAVGKIKSGGPPPAMPPRGIIKKAGGKSMDKGPKVMPAVGGGGSMKRPPMKPGSGMKGGGR